MHLIATCLVIADIDSDQCNDIVFGGQLAGDGKVQFYLNNKHNDLEPTLHDLTSIVQSSVNHFVVQDLTQDSQADVLVALDLGLILYEKSSGGLSWTNHSIFARLPSSYITW